MHATGYIYPSFKFKLFIGNENYPFLLITDRNYFQLYVNPDFEK